VPLAIDILQRHKLVDRHDARTGRFFVWKGGEWEEGENLNERGDPPNDRLFFERQEEAENGDQGNSD
jgi:hypothetical protein